MSFNVRSSLSYILGSGLNYLIIRCIVGIEISFNIALGELDDCVMIIIVEENRLCKCD
jgi:hypothetical protein